ncbi:unnamed protein product, partial [Callosobruchus maculatus]
MRMSEWSRALARLSVLETYYDKPSVRIGVDEIEQDVDEDCWVEYHGVSLVSEDHYSGVQIKEADVGQPCIECDRCEEGYEPHDWRYAVYFFSLVR